MKPSVQRYSGGDIEPAGQAVERDGGDAGDEQSLDGGGAGGGFDGFIEFSDETVFAHDFGKEGKIERDEFVGEMVVFVNEDVNGVRDFVGFVKAE